MRIEKVDLILQMLSNDYRNMTVTCEIIVIFKIKVTNLKQYIKKTQTHSCVGW